VRGKWLVKIVILKQKVNEIIRMFKQLKQAFK
jgi:hypothetical protein